MRRYQTKSGGQVLKPATPDLVDHVRFAITTARAGTRCWIKSRDPDDELSRFYSAEFRRSSEGGLIVTCFEWQIIINPRDAMAPAWLNQLATTVDNLTMQGATT
jgi:hypothetical protein